MSLLKLTGALLALAALLTTALALVTAVMVVVIVLCEGGRAASEEECGSRHEKCLFHLAPPITVD